MVCFSYHLVCAESITDSLDRRSYIIVCDVGVIILVLFRLYLNLFLTFSFFFTLHVKSKYCLKIFCDLTNVLNGDLTFFSDVWLTFYPAVVMASFVVIWRLAFFLQFYNSLLMDHVIWLRFVIINYIMYYVYFLNSHHKLF